MLVWCRKCGGEDLKLIYNDNRNTHPGDQSEECIEEPACKAFKTWGFTDASCWKPKFKKNPASKYEPCPLVFDHHLKPKDNMRFRVRKNLSKGKPNIIKDQLVVLTGKHKGVEVRRVEAWVEIDDEWRRMVFITNNLEWSPQTVCDLFRRFDLGGTEAKR